MLATASSGDGKAKAYHHCRLRGLDSFPDRRISELGYPRCWYMRQKPVRSSRRHYISACCRSRAPPVCLDGLEIRSDARVRALGPCGVQGCQHNARKEPDDGYHDQKFYRGEAASFW